MISTFRIIKSVNKVNRNIKEHKEVIIEIIFFLIFPSGKILLKKTKLPTINMGAVYKTLHQKIEYSMLLDSLYNNMPKHH
jgi:hypothetical protein